MISLLGFQIKPTIFPDKTSQVWKLEPKLIQLLEKSKSLTLQIEWEFENEAELIHVSQLKMLIHPYCNAVTLGIPYLPYARQDKRVSNETTFALLTFCHLLNTMAFHRIYTIDAHSDVAHNILPNMFDTKAKHFFKPSKELVLCYPDKGAEKRYKNQFIMNDYIVMDKKRNQLTGEIEGLTCPSTDICLNKIVTIVDDICDGGRTFIEAAKVLKYMNPKEIHLYVSHGIFSQGLKPLTDAGISKIFTHKGEVNIKKYYEGAIDEA
jgi:phosphoribosylpyrophosphate synthetase